MKTDSDSFPDSNAAVDEELFDVVNEHDVVMEVLPRSVVHARKLLHRACHVFVFNTSGQLLIHLRANTKDEYPSLWSVSASGHLSSGEGYDVAASRELFEELGLDGALEMIGQFPASAQTSFEHLRIYRLVSDQQPVFDGEEIQEGRYLFPEEIDSWLSSRPDDFTPSFRLLWSWYAETYLSSEV